MSVHTERVAQGPTRLLLVEDYAPLAEGTAELLRDAGLAVRITESGQEALRAATEFRPQIVLLDLSLPDMSGLDVARALRSNPDSKDALIAMHTAMSDIHIRTFHGQIPEINLFLPKPLTYEMIGSLLAELAVLQRDADPGQDPSPQKY